LRSGPLTARQRSPHLGDDGFGMAEEVRGRESQDPVASTDEGVLAAIVFNQAVAMVATVVFDDEAV
jgi:hypothetical protein